MCIKPESAGNVDPLISMLHSRGSLKQEVDMTTQQGFRWF